MFNFGKNDPNQQSATDRQQLQEFVSELTKSQGRIGGYIVSLMPGSSDVGDVLQETNLTLWKSQITRASTLSSDASLFWIVFNLIDKTHTDSNSRYCTR